MTNHEAWYQSWFDTEYYHILYQHRDDHEAQLFIRNLIAELNPPHDAHILDLACGRGRHAFYLHRLDYNVTGLDLSPSNIEYANSFAEEGLDFEVGDMRESMGRSRFDYIFNLFTSFGYFEHWDENVLALIQMRRALKPHGMLVMDFMNVNKVRLGLVEEEVRPVDDIEFHIERFIRDERVIKQIRFEHKGESFQYEEKVQLLQKSDFEKMYAEAGLKIERLYGDFELNDFDSRNSERLILFASVK